MADTKISALTAATTPLAGTELVPIVQGGATVKVAVSAVGLAAFGPPPTVTYSGGTFAPPLISYPMNVQPDGIAGWGATTYVFTGTATDVTVDGLNIVMGELQLQTGTLVNVSFPALSYCSNTLTTSTNALLETVAFTNLSVATGIDISACDVLASIDLTALRTTTFLSVRDDPVLTTLSLPALISLDEFTVGTDGGAGVPLLTTISMPSLVSCTNGLDFTQCQALLTLDLGALETTASIIAGLTEDPTLISVDLGSLVTVSGNFTIRGTGLTTLDLHSLTSVNGSFDFNYNAALATLDLSALLACTGTAGFFGNAFTEATVDALLVKFASLDGTNGTTVFENSALNLSGGTNAIPSATGLAAKAVLEARGNTVTVNS